MHEEASLNLTKDPVKKKSRYNMGSISNAIDQPDKLVNQLNPPSQRRLNHDRALRLGI